MVLADSARRRRWMDAIDTARGFSFPKDEQLSQPFDAADCRHTKPDRAKPVLREVARIPSTQKTCFSLQTCGAGPSLSHLFFLQNSPYLCVVVMALMLASTTPAWAAAQPTTAAAEAPGHMMASRQGQSDVGIRGHGFVAGNGVFTTVDAPGANLFTVAFGIDDRGRTVGGYVEERGRLHGFLKDKEAFTVIDFPGAAATFVSRINVQGQIVGVYSETVSDPQVATDIRSFLFDRGEFTQIDVPNAVTTRAQDIDNHGRVVGEYLDAAGATHGFLRDSSGAFTTIDVPGATGTGLSGINDRGQMIGVYGDAGGTIHAFLLDNGVVTIIDVPDATLTQPYGINNRGQIVGAYTDNTGTYAFLLSDGAITTINPPGALVQFITAFDIDDRGRIVGIY